MQSSFTGLLWNASTVYLVMLYVHYNYMIDLITMHSSSSYIMNGAIKLACNHSVAHWYDTLSLEDHIAHLV